MTTSPKTSARDRLLDAAKILFYNHGISATGIDSITTRAGVAKKSLYNNFASKADLVKQYIEARHDEWLALYARRLGESDDPKAGVLAVFDAYQDHAEDAYERGFRGCGLLNAAAELPVGDAGRAAVRQHKRQVEAILHTHLAARLTDDEATTMAAHFSFLLEGAMTRAGLEGNSAPILTARAIAARILAGV